MSKPIQCIIIDDEDISRNIIAKFIKKTRFLVLLKAFSNPEDGLAFVLENNVDLILLDIEMPEMTGIEVIQSLEERPDIILITSKKEYAIQAYEFDVTDYILKPFEYSRFFKAVSKVKEKFDNQFDSIPTRHDPEDIFIRHNSRYLKITGKDVIWIEAIGDYAEIHTRNRKYTIHSTMKAIEKKLPNNDFVRVHRSYIVRLDLVCEIEDSTLSVESKIIPIGKSYKDNLLKRITLI